MIELTDKQRRQLLAGEAPHLPLSVEEAQSVEAGQRIEVKPGRFAIVVEGVGRNRERQLFVRYRIVDDRPRFLRRNPHAMDVGAIRRGLDRYGTPRRVSEQDAEAAIEASHYTGSEAQAVVDAGEAVPVEVQTRLTMEARARDAERGTGERAVELFDRQAKSFASDVRGLGRRAAQAGVDLGPVLVELRGRLEERIEAELRARPCGEEEAA